MDDNSFMKKIIKHLVKKSFSVFNGPRPKTIEHTKTFFGQMFYYFSLSKYVKNIISIISRLVYHHFVNLVNKGYFIQ